MALGNLPNLLERNLAAFRKLDVVSFRVAPGLAEVIRRTKKRSPVRTVHRRPQSLTIITPIIGKRIDAASGKIRSGFVPLVARRVRTKKERPFHRPDKQQVVASLNIDLHWFRHLEKLQSFD